MPIINQVYLKKMVIKDDDDVICDVILTLHKWRYIDFKSHAMVKCWTPDCGSTVDFCRFFRRKFMQGCTTQTSAINAEMSIWDVEGGMIMLATFSGWFTQCIKLVINVLNQSPNSFGSNIRHQYPCNRQFFSVWHLKETDNS